MGAHFDLCIIGTGSGNSILDERFDDWSVAMVERGTFGGTCLNVGCIPSKMLIYPADVATTAVESEQVGVSARVERIDWPAIRDRTFGRIDPIAADGEDYRRRAPNVTVYAEHGWFVGERALAVGDEVITADRFIIAAGARAAVPPIDGLHEVPFHTSDTIMRIDAVPRRLGVLGGGFIAAEMGHVFDAYGADVTMMIRSERLLRSEDEEISTRITRALARRFDLRTDATPRRVDHDGTVFHVELDGGDTVEIDELLVAYGRHPNGDELCVEAAGVELDADGYIITDSALRTTADGVWALGDVTNPQQLKHVANYEARVCQHNVLHPDRPMFADERVIPHAVFTHPQIGSVGATEQELVDAGVPYVRYVQEMGDVAYGWAMADTEGCCKLLADPNTRRILGAHVIGPQAATLIQPVVQAMQFGQTVDQLAHDVMYPHPALTEVLENACIGITRQLG